LTKLKTLISNLKLQLSPRFGLVFVSSLSQFLGVNLVVPQVYSWCWIIQRDGAMVTFEDVDINKEIEICQDFNSLGALSYLAELVLPRATDAL
jgi:hypothetical protein